MTTTARCKQHDPEPPHDASVPAGDGRMDLVEAEKTRRETACTYATDRSFLTKSRQGDLVTDTERPGDGGLDR